MASLFTRPLLPEGSSLQVEILFVCLSVRHHFNISNLGPSNHRKITLYIIGKMFDISDDNDNDKDTHKDKYKDKDKDNDNDKDILRTHPKSNPRDL